jgi:transcriptional regulator with PAS, ATPase and Fis domain
MSYSSNLVHQLADVGIIGSSEIMQRAGMIALQAAPTDLSVLLTGESGVGKEVFAKAIHRMSKRKRLPFVSVNCGAIPETLLEAELFGNEKGAFTGAVEQRKGFFEAAHKATIFLDEIGEMPVATQVKLLRLLESGEFSRLGSSEIRVCDVRVIAATNRDLEHRVAIGEFRRDLFYRLNAVRIELPSLYEHREDIPEIVQYLATTICARLQITYQGISDSALATLMQLPFEGNIRELKNIIEVIVTLEHGAFITPEMIVRYIPKQQLQGSAYSSSITPGAVVHLPHKTSEQVEREIMYKALLEIREEMVLLRQDMRAVKDRLGIREFSTMPPLPEKSHTSQSVASTTTAIVPTSGEYALVSAVAPFIPTTTRLEGLPHHNQTQEFLHHDTLANLNHEAIDAEHEVVQAETIPHLEQSIDMREEIFDRNIIVRLDDIEKMMILRAIDKYRGNRRLASEALGISERTLYRKLHEYGMATD